MPRILEGDSSAPAKVRPRTSLLRTNLPDTYYVHEEEVPRAGAVVFQSFERTRKSDGAVVTWFGARKETRGRLEWVAVRCARTHRTRSDRLAGSSVYARFILPSNALKRGWERRLVNRKEPLIPNTAPARSS
jgi:hypothetical protein